jgi:hypothetical protein
MNARTATAGLLLVALVTTFAATGRGDEPPARDLDKVVEGLLPKNWVAERQTVTDLERVLPGVRSYFCRLLARGGYPYEKIAVANDGTVLDRSNGRVLMARAEAETITARRGPNGWSVAEGSAAGVAPLLNALVARAPKAGLHPGRALTAAVALLDLLTHRGSFVSASVKTTDLSGLEVVVDWRQGSGLWSFEERARWTLRFDRSGKLQEFEKARTVFTRHLRK